MKKFIIKGILFLLIAAIILTSFELFNIYYSKDYTTKVHGAEVYWSIFKSKNKKQVKKLLIGDSVCKQLYDNYEYNDSIYSLACNQAITVAGQYFLLYNFLQTNNDQLPQEIILFYNPGSFENNIDIYAFQYFLKPFYNAEYRGLMDDYLLSRIKEIPFYYITQLPFIKTSNYSPEYQLKNEEYGIFSPLSKIYLEKIVQLCEEKNIVFRLEPVPVKKMNEEIIEKLKQNKTNIPDINPDILEDYFSKVTYFEDTLFIDNAHFKREYIPHDYLNLGKNDAENNR